MYDALKYVSKFICSASETGSITSWYVDVPRSLAPRKVGAHKDHAVSRYNDKRAFSDTADGSLAAINCTAATHGKTTIVR
jgi:hypothetical protein